MNITRRLYVSACAAAVIGALGTSSVQAATATTTFQVTANVLATCTVSAGTLAFGNYTGLVQVTSTTTIVATCTDTTTYNIGLNAGLGIGATINNRSMTDTSLSHSLPYHLYSDAAHTQNWGDTIGVDTVTGTGTGLAQNFTVYGEIATGSLVEPEAYTDTITVTVTY